MPTEPQGHSHAEQIAWRMQGLLIRAAVKAGKQIPAVPTLDQMAADLKTLLERQRSEIRLELELEIMSPKSAEEGRGLLITKLAIEDRQKIANLTEILDRERHGGETSGIEFEGGENSTMYPPKKP